ncbi:MAG: transglutaminase family protein [Phycisphaerales bacterium]|nr:transglutaminase family protein [Phycisphaerales bacterium]
MSCTALITLLSTLAAPMSPQAATAGQDRWVNAPTGALRREKPRGYTIGLSVDIGATSQVIADPNALNSTGGEFNVDMVVAGNWTVADPNAIQGSARINGIPTGASPRATGTPGDDTFTATIPVPKGPLNALSFRVEWPAISFNSVVDENLAAQATWPREWPADTRQYLSPSTGIPSEDQVYQQFVQRTSDGQLRTVPLYYAAKDLVRAAILEFRNVRPSFVVQENGGLPRGFDLQVARVRGELLRGDEASASDLVCSCIAVLRAAGIPSRPVIGIDSGKGREGKLAKGKTRFAVWGEFHLPGSGWVPFDPYNMRGTSMSSSNVRSQWKWFGTNKELNRRVALAYDFAPFRLGATSEYPAGWSMTISGTTRAGLEIDSITVPLLISRGSITP